MREWWVGDRKDNRDRKFGGRERGGREDAWGAGGGRERGERAGRERGGGSWTRAADDTAEIDSGMVLNLIQSRDEVGCCPFTSVSCICP